MGNDYRSPKKERKFISKETFTELTPGQKVELNHFVGQAYIASAPSIKGGVDFTEYDVVTVQFTSGVWTNKNDGLIEVTRQHIKRIL